MVMLTRVLCLWATLVLNATIAKGHRIPTRNECPPFKNGTIVIDSYQLYPENADFDLNQCLLYFGSVPTYYLFLTSDT